MKCLSYIEEARCPKVNSCLKEFGRAILDATQMSKLDAVRNSSYSQPLCVIVPVLGTAVYVVKLYYDDRDSRNVQEILNALAVLDCTVLVSLFDTIRVIQFYLI